VVGGGGRGCVRRQDAAAGGRHWVDWDSRRGGRGDWVVGSWGRAAWRGEELEGEAERAGREFLDTAASINAKVGAVGRLGVNSIRN
jgi:hypothetical protein